MRSVHGDHVRGEVGFGVERGLLLVPLPESRSATMWQQSLDEFSGLGLQLFVKLHFEQLTQLIDKEPDLPILAA